MRPRMLAPLGYGNDMSGGLSFKTIRTWDGSQYRAFEELAFQLREPAPVGAVETKTGDPDAGVEWYVTFDGGEQWVHDPKHSQITSAPEETARYRRV